ncbi:MAG: NirD/YgiW/YdeI family stress tolerance protein [Prochloraceae cyanobacterium]
MKNLDKTCAIFSLAATSLMIGLSATAQEQVNTVSSIMENPVDEMEVTLVGNIISKEEGKHQRDYTFKDETGEITVEIEDENFKYDSDTTVKISGKVSLESQEDEAEQQDETPEYLEIEVDHLQVMGKSNE